MTAMVEHQLCPRHLLNSIRHNTNNDRTVDTLHKPEAQIPFPNMNRPELAPIHKSAKSARKGTRVGAVVPMRSSGTDTLSLRFSDGDVKLEYAV